MQSADDLSVLIRVRRILVTVFLIHAALAPVLAAGALWVLGCRGPDGHPVPVDAGAAVDADGRDRQNVVIAANPEVGAH